MTPYRVPAGTTEITYTRGGGEQRSIPVQDLGDGYLFAQGADADDDAHLAGLGYPVARKVLGEQDEEPATPARRSTRRSTRKAAAKARPTAAPAEPPQSISEEAQPAPPAETTAGSEG